MSIEKRSGTRYWCSDLVQVSTKDGIRWKRAGVAVLEDISVHGACLQMEAPIKKGTAIRFRHSSWTGRGVVKYCYFREIGYFIGMEFAEDSRWSPQAFQPKHMVDPQEIVAARLQRRTKAAGAGH